MTFNPTTEDLWQEIRKAEEEARKHLEPTRDILRRLTGRFYSTEHRDMTPDPENHGFAFMSNLLPSLVFSDPEVAVTAARIIGHKTTAEAMEDGLNAWVRDANYAKRVEPVVVNLLYSRGVLLHYLDEDGRFSRGDVLPSVRWIDPDTFFIDGLADSTETDQFRGHWYYADIDDLKGDPAANPAVVQRLESDGGESHEHRGKPSGSELGRRRVRIYSIWVRERNELRTLVAGIEDAELYEPREYFGPDSGPYQLFDAYPVPGEAWPLAPLVAVEDQSLDLNLHARALQRSAGRRKSIALVEASNPDLGEKLAEAEDGEILPVKGITGNHVEIELGGPTETQFKYTEYARVRLDRNSGLTANIQGAVGQADTATEAKIAEDALTNRTDYIRRAVTRSVEQSLDKIAWYLFHTEGIVIPVNRRDAYSGEMFEGVFLGGPVGSENMAWDDFDLRIRVNTMQLEAAARQNMLGFYQVFREVVQVAPSMPWVRWMNVLRDMAEAFELGDKAEQWIIPEMFGGLGQPQQLPPSQFLNSPAPPQQADQFRYGGSQNKPRLPGGNPLQGSVGQSQAAGSPNTFDATGRAQGPRPRQEYQAA